MDSLECKMDSLKCRMLTWSHVVLPNKFWDQQMSNLACDKLVMWVYTLVNSVNVVIKVHKVIAYD